MHFGENQLSPRSVGISPLPTSHPPVLQHWWVRASTDFHIRFTLLMGSSRGFGSLDGYLPRACTQDARPVQTRFPSGSPPLLGVNRATAKHSPDHSTKGTPSAPWWLLPQWPLTAGAFAGSGSLSSPSRGAFHLSLTVLVRYRSRQFFSLGGWSPRLPTGFPVSRGTQDLRPPIPMVCPYGIVTLSDAAFQPLRVDLGWGAWRVLQPRTGVAACPVWAAPRSLATTEGISFDFCSSGY